MNLFQNGEGGIPVIREWVGMTRREKTKRFWGDSPQQIGALS
ncbi:hypothetical protein [Prochlorococcus sp. MIT 1303]|nr:hypothetical protein [Prochlorococcus sp. MIT 1303]